MSRSLQSLTRLVYALRALPGVGPRSAERLAYYLLQSKDKALHLAQTIENALQLIQQCRRCNTYTDHEYCHECQDERRDKQVLCIVETPHDLLAIEQSGVYAGYYYVLMGRISPLEDRGPESLQLEKLRTRVQEGEIEEVIFALSPTVEGQTTLHCIQALLQPFNVRLSQLAHGIPLGSDLAMLDRLTIGSALTHRISLSD